jgi:cytochrome oxidase assembly protein ShyY1
LNSYKSKILIFAIIFAPITFSLGLWQIERAAEKDNIIEKFNELQNNPHKPINTEDKFANWEPISSYGTFTQYIILEDNALLDGQAGYKVYQYFRFEENSGVFVNRGFIARGRLKNEVPEITTPSGQFLIKGSALYKNSNAFVKNIEESDKRIIQEFNIGLISNVYPELRADNIRPYIFNLDKNDQFKFKEIEKPINMSSDKHIGYAIQWFGLCLVLIVLTIIAFRRKDE